MEATKSEVDMMLEELRTRMGMVKNEFPYGVYVDADGNEVK